MVGDLGSVCQSDKMVLFVGGGGKGGNQTNKGWGDRKAPMTLVLRLKSCGTVVFVDDADAFHIRRVHAPCGMLLVVP